MNTQYSATKAISRGFAKFAFLSTIFLNAFVDLGHKITLQNTVFKVEDGAEQVILTAFINGLILLPYIVFFSLAGKTSDRFPRPNVMKASALGAVFLTSGITLSYFLGWFWLSVGFTFLLAVQSAFYYPAKLGYIRSLYGRESLASGNGWAQATVIMAILTGTVFFSALFEWRYFPEYSEKSTILPAMVFSGALLIVLSVLEFIFAYQLPIFSDARNSSCQEENQVLTKNTSAILPVKHPEVIRAILGLMVFWSAGQTMLAVFPAFAKEQLGITNTLMLQGILASTGIGIGIGAGLSGWLSKRKKNKLKLLRDAVLEVQDICEWRCLKIGALGYIAGALMIPWLSTPLLQAANFLWLGVMGGLFIVPLNTAMQFYCPEGVLGRLLAGSSLLQNVAMLSCLLMTMLAAFMATNPFLMLVTMGVAIALVLGWIIFLSLRADKPTKVLSQEFF